VIRREEQKMSADNWAACHRCLLRAERERERKPEEAAAAYGKVDRAAWLEMQASAGGTVTPGEFKTFREDYEIGVREDGKLKINYGGSCSACGLTAKFRHEVQVEALDAPPVRKA
jgi:hypothetical protein